MPEHRRPGLKSGRWPGRPAGGGQPDKVAPGYVLPAATDSAGMTGQTLHPNGGEVVDG